VTVYRLTLLLIQGASHSSQPSRARLLWVDLLMRFVLSLIPDELDENFFSKRVDRRSSGIGLLLDHLEFTSAGPNVSTRMIKLQLWRDWYWQPDPDREASSSWQPRLTTFFVPIYYVQITYPCHSSSYKLVTPRTRGLTAIDRR
jgi:hypothetical protein